MPDPSLTSGATVWIRGRPWRLDRIRRSRVVVALDVSSRGESRTFFTPFDRAVVAARRRRLTRVRLRHAAARLAGVAARLPAARSIDSAVGAQVALLPYQLEPALAIVAGDARRVLIADDVGLGKTVQAAYAIAEVVRREPFARVLVLTPTSLIDQWRAELAGRFGIETVAMDRDSLDEAARHLSPGDSPWRAAGVRVASLDFLKQPHIFDALPATSCDLLVVDEAHTACGDSERHARLESIAARSRRVLLLTATPHDGDPIKFRRLLSLGQLASAEAPLVVFRRTRAQAGFAIARRTRRHHVALAPAERHALDALDRFGRLSTANASGLDLLMTVLRKRAMSTMAALAVSLERRRQWLDVHGVSPDVWRQTTLPFEMDDDGGDSEWRALTGDTGIDPLREREWLTRLGSLAAGARRHDSKIARVATLIKRTREPVIVFTEYRDSLEALRLALSRVATLAVLHGAQSPVERRAELRRFLGGDVRVLAATDVAGVGLNLHERARWVITLDLPWNPMRLEQRIGRVDRIGQQRAVHHTILVARHAYDSHVQSHLERRATTAAAALDVDAGATARASDNRLPIPCARYRRTAQWIARTIDRRRDLARHWRASHSPASAGRARLRASGSTSTLVVFAVPILNGYGVEVDSRLVAYRVGWTPAGGGSLENAIRCARERAIASGRRRAARLTRWRRAVHATGERRDRAVSAVSSTPARPVDVGLFDHREWRVQERRREVTSRDLRDEREHQRMLRLCESLRAGMPELVCILEAAR